LFFTKKSNIIQRRYIIFSLQEYAKCRKDREAEEKLYAECGRQKLKAHLEQRKQRKLEREREKERERRMKEEGMVHLDESDDEDLLASNEPGGRTGTSSTTTTSTGTMRTVSNPPTDDLEEEEEEESKYFTHFIKQLSYS